MIFVTVGTEKFPFDRLAHWIDLLIREGFITNEEPVIFQSGSCSFHPTGTLIFPLLTETKFRQLLSKAKLIIAHCGDGTLRVLDQVETPYILVPRSHRFHEHVDDHQIELAQVLESMDIPIAWSPGDLVRFIALPRRIDIPLFSSVSINKLCQDLDNRFSSVENFY